MMPPSRQKDAYLLGSSDQDTEGWFTAIMQPTIGAVYARSAKKGSAPSKKSGELMKSPHRKNSLTPGSSVAMTAAAAAANAAGVGVDAATSLNDNEAIASADGASSPSNADQFPASCDVAATSKAPKSAEKIATTTVSVSPSADTALKRSESALLEAAKLAEGWRLSETEDFDVEGNELETQAI